MYGRSRGAVRSRSSAIVESNEDSEMKARLPASSAFRSGRSGQSGAPAIIQSRTAALSSADNSGPPSGDAASPGMTTRERMSRARSSAKTFLAALPFNPWHLKHRSAKIVFTRRALSGEDGFDVDCWPPADLGTSAAAEASDAHNTKNKRCFFDLTDIANLLRGSEVVDLPHNGVHNNRSATDMPFLERFAIACAVTATGSAGRHGEKKVKSHCST